MRPGGSRSISPSYRTYSRSVKLLEDGGAGSAGRIAQMRQLLNDSLLIFGFVAIVLAPLTLVLDTGPGGAGWKLLTFLCCTLTAWLFFFGSNQLIALVAWALAWACAIAMRITFYRLGA
jgi:hypothetical protein